MLMPLLLTQGLRCTVLYLNSGVRHSFPLGIQSSKHLRAHYAFVCIHPFADGNGRVSRALASVFLYRSPGIPLVIFADQKNTYIDALEAADKGKYNLFVQFIADVCTDTVGLFSSDAER